MDKTANFLTGISTESLENLILRMLEDMTTANSGNRSFGVNVTEWEKLRAAVEEYIRMCRNAWSARDTA